MTEAYVQLVCPTCSKDWQAAPHDLPEPDATFVCPDCETERDLREFMRTARDLEILQDFSGSA